MTTNQIKLEKTDDSEADARTLGLLWGGWIAVSATIVAIGFGVEAVLWPGIGEGITLVGLISFLASASIFADLMLALPQRWQYVIFGVMGVLIVVLAGVLYRYAPYAFDSLMQFAAMVGGVLGAVVILMLGRIALEKFGADPEGEA